MVLQNIQSKLFGKNRANVSKEFVWAADLEVISQDEPALDKQEIPNELSSVMKIEANHWIEFCNAVNSSMNDYIEREDQINTAVALTICYGFLLLFVGLILIGVYAAIASNFGFKVTAGDLVGYFLLTLFAVMFGVGFGGAFGIMPLLRWRLQTSLSRTCQQMTEDCRHQLLFQYQMTSEDYQDDTTDEDGRAQVTTSTIYNHHIVVYRPRQPDQDKQHETNIKSEQTEEELVEEV